MVGFYSPEAAAAAASMVGGVVFFGALAFAVDQIKAACRRPRKAARPALDRKPGPAKREEQRQAIRARAAELQRDTAAGIIAPLGERVGVAHDGA